MANPLVSQGQLNKLLGSVVFTSLPTLNVTPSFLGKDGISLVLEGEATTIIDMMTGVVPSPEPYQVCRVEVHLNKAQNLSNLFKLQYEASTYIGDMTVRPDSSVLGPYQIINSSIVSIVPASFAGASADFLVTIRGAYNINSNLWN